MCVHTKDVRAGKELTFVPEHTDAELLGLRFFDSRSDLDGNRPDS
jgi:hypothetical protein